ncbi:hypothetical protein LCGC14_3132400 [marine sediment metagenome]|uniref:GIY-YIG domain-containing protein n=1 Tax=marine sediment metagenome TaxID=412755 RepID=A0A0F8VZA0_9ZZZZ
MTPVFWYVYIIRAENGRLYTGIALDPDVRFEHHRNGTGAKFFSFSPPEEVVYREEHPNRSEAQKRELKIKGMTRIAKLALIEEYRRGFNG